MQILADRIEFCWVHLEGIGTLENSLWGYDGHGIRLWLDALTLESSDAASNTSQHAVESVQESVNIPLSFYPLCKLNFELSIMDGTKRHKSSRVDGQGDHHWR